MLSWSHYLRSDLQKSVCTSFFGKADVVVYFLTASTNMLSFAIQIGSPLAYLQFLSSLKKKFNV